MRSAHKKSKVQSVLHPARFKKTRADGSMRIVRDTYHNKGVGSWWAINKQVLDRDGHRCTARIRLPNGSMGRCPNTAHLHVHHLTRLSVGGVTKTDRLVTLCESCHKKRHSGM